MKKLGEELVEAGVITARQVDRALLWQVDDGDRIGALLMRLGYVDEEELLGHLGKRLSTETVLLGSVEPEPEALAAISREMARQAEAIPLSLEQRKLTIAMKDPDNLYALDDIRAATGKRIEVRLASDPAIEAALASFYAEPVEADSDDGADEPERGGQVGDQVRDWIERWLDSGAEGMVIENTPGGLIVRCDGAGSDGNREIAVPPAILHFHILNQLRSLADLGPAKGGTEQGGSFLHPFRGQDRQLRLTLTPTPRGERARLAEAGDDAA